jgi:DnaK suppressor protein
MELPNIQNDLSVCGTDVNTDKVPDVAGIPEQWNWHCRVLMALRKRLLDDRVNRIADVSETMERHSTMMRAAMVDFFDHDLALRMLSRDEYAIREIDAALSRISAGTYGICESTGHLISEEYLRNMPWTRWTEETANKLERQGSTRILRLNLAEFHNNFE